MSVQEGMSTDWDAAAGIPDLSNPDYNAIVVSTSSPLTDSELSALREYAQKYSVRIAYLNANADMAGAAVEAGGDEGGFVAFDPSEYASTVGDILQKQQVSVWCM